MKASEYREFIKKTNFQNPDNSLLTLILTDILEKLEQIEERTPAFD